MKVDPGLMLALIFLACTEPGVWPVPPWDWMSEEVKEPEPDKPRYQLTKA